MLFPAYLKVLALASNLWKEALFGASYGKLYQQDEEQQIKTPPAGLERAQPLWLLEALQTASCVLKSTAL